MRFIYLFLFFISIQTTRSQNQFVPDDLPYETDLETARTANKPLFIMLYADWCPHCNQMKKEVFSDPAVMDFLKKIMSASGKILKKKKEKCSEKICRKGKVNLRRNDLEYQGC